MSTLVHLLIHPRIDTQIPTQITPIPKNLKMFSTGEQEEPLHAPLRTYTLHGAGGANSRDLSIFRAGGSSAVYNTSIAATIDMHHPNSITLTNPADTTVGVARMYHGCEIINLALGDPEDFGQRENCVWEDLHVKKPAVLKGGAPPTHDFGLGLGDDSRRDFQWVLDRARRPSHPSRSPSAEDAHHNNNDSHANGNGRTHTWSLSEHVPGLSHTHSFGGISLGGAKSAPKKDGGVVTAVHEVHVDHHASGGQCFKLVDQDDGEIVAMLLRHEDVQNGVLVRDEDPSVRGKFVIFRDFWQPGQYQEEWDKMILLSGLAVLERGDRE